MSSLDNFLDADNRVKQWPSKHANKQFVLEYLATKFDYDVVYTERQVNEILINWHTFGDWAILRRSLVDSGYLQRNRDGTQYRLVSKEA